MSEMLMKVKIEDEDHGICLKCGHEELPLAGLELSEHLIWDLRYENNTDFRKVVNYTQVMNLYKNAITEIQSKCKHQIHESRFHNKGRIVRAGGIMNCPKCDLRIEGWYCPESKSHQCDYEQEDGKYDEDHCRYCGHPSERK